MVAKNILIFINPPRASAVRRQEAYKKVSWGCQVLCTKKQTWEKPRGERGLSLARARKLTVCASALSAPANVEEMAGCDDRTRRRTIGVMTAWLLEFLLASPRERFDILGGELLQVA